MSHLAHSPLWWFSVGTHQGNQDPFVIKNYLQDLLLAFQKHDHDRQKGDNKESAFDLILI